MELYDLDVGDMVDRSVTVIAYTVLWICIFFMVRLALLRELAAHVSLRCLASFHSLLIVTYIAVHMEWESFYSHCGRYSRFWQINSAIVSFSYFAFAFVVSIYADLEENRKISHIHLLYNAAMVTVLGIVVYTNKSGSELTAYLCLTEITVPLLHFRSFLKAFDLNGTPLYTLVEYLYVTIFGMARIGLGPPLVWAVVSSGAHVLLKLGAVAAIMASIVDFAHMMRAVMRRNKVFGIGRRKASLRRAASSGPLPPLHRTSSRGYAASGPGVVSPGRREPGVTPGTRGVLSSGSSFSAAGAAPGGDINMAARFRPVGPGPAPATTPKGPAWGQPISSSDEDGSEDDDLDSDERGLLSDMSGGDGEGAGPVSAKRAARALDDDDVSSGPEEEQEDTWEMEKARAEEAAMRREQEREDLRKRR